MGRDVPSWVGEEGAFVVDLGIGTGADAGGVSMDKYLRVDYTGGMNVQMWRCRVGKVAGCCWMWWRDEIELR